MPAQQIYWKTEFWAVAIVAFSPDFIFTAAQIVASNSVSKDKQGIAGSLIGTLMTYGMSTGLGFGGTVEVYTNRGGTDLLRGYRGALYLGVGFGAISLILSLLFVRINKDEREGWDDREGMNETEAADKSERTGEVG
jgi:predicted MFS family arabinose efflux permease